MACSSGAVTSVPLLTSEIASRGFFASSELFGVGVPTSREVLRRGAPPLGIIGGGQRLLFVAPPLGFLGPRLWQVMEQYPGEAFLVDRELRVPPVLAHHGLPDRLSIDRLGPSVP